MLYELKGERPFVESRDVFVAPNAAVIGKVRLGHQSSVWFAATLRGDNEEITVGAGSNIQDGSVLHTDPGCPLIIAKDVTVGHNVTLHGCILEERIIVGMGAVILNKAIIPSDCIIGAGALVTEGKTFDAGSLILGAPARCVRQLTEAEKAGIRHSAARYRQKAENFNHNLKLC